MAGRLMAGVAIALISGAAGYYLHGANSGAALSSAAITAPPSNSVRVLYSLTDKRNDREVIALIDSAQRYVSFAMYEFTLRDIADALVAAKKRGVDVQGVVDSVESAKSYSKPIIAELLAAAIPVKTEKHPDGSGIMHIKALTTEKAYAIGSYNWTASATTENDEFLEIGTAPELVQTYSGMIKHLIDIYPAADAQELQQKAGGELDISEAGEHVGQTAHVRGTLVNAHTAASGTVFLDFCKQYRTCPFSAVIFADNAKEFGDLSKFVGKEVVLSGKIQTYQSRAEIILRTPDQISASRAAE